MLRNLMLFIVIKYNLLLKRFLRKENRTWFDDFIVKRIIKRGPWKKNKISC